MNEIIQTVFQKLSLFGHWAYLFIFLAAVLETSAFVGLLVPGESIVVLAGFLASQGTLELGDCLWIITLAAVLGDTVGYHIGRVLGRNYFTNHERLLLIKRKHIEKAESYFQAHGGKTIFLGRFVGFLRALAPLIAGMSRMRYRTFLTYNVLGAVIWACCFTFMGYYFGKSWPLVEQWAGKIGLFLFFLFILIVAFVSIAKMLLRRQIDIEKQLHEIHQWSSKHFPKTTL